MREHTFPIPYIQLVKAPLCFVVALSALFGHYLYLATISASSLHTFFGIFFLSCSAACLNSYQEIELDRRFARTKNRPLVTGVISPHRALLVSIGLFISGSFFLYTSSISPVPALLGVCTFIIYNFIYTPLKTRHVYALFPGGVVGALPPYIGWITAGGSPTELTIWLVMALFFLWQIPHYFLVMLEYSSDYLVNDMSKVNLLRAPLQTKHIIFIWVLAFATVLLSFTTLPHLLPFFCRLLLLSLTVLLLFYFIHNLYFAHSVNYRRLFISFNGVIVIVMVIISTGRGIIA